MGSKQSAFTAEQLDAYQVSATISPTPSAPNSPAQAGSVGPAGRASERGWHKVQAGAWDMRPAPTAATGTQAVRADNPTPPLSCVFFLSCRTPPSSQGKRLSGGQPAQHQLHPRASERAGARQRLPSLAWGRPPPSDTCFVHACALARSSLPALVFMLANCPAW